MQPQATVPYTLDKARVQTCVDKLGHGCQLSHAALEAKLDPEATGFLRRRGVVLLHPRANIWVSETKKRGRVGAAEEEKGGGDDGEEATTKRRMDTKIRKRATSRTRTNKRTRQRITIKQHVRD